MKTKQAECGHEHTTPTNDGRTWKCDLCGLVYTPERVPHTPGPFSYSGSDNVVMARVGNVRIAIAEFFWGDGINREEADANKILFAGSPELLETAERVLSVVYADPAHLDNAIAQLSAAVNAARGNAS